MKTRWKIVLTIVLAVVTWYVNDRFFQRDSAPRAAGESSSCNVITKSPVPVMNAVELRAWFKTYNRDYFFGHLPEVRFEWVNLHYKLRMAETDCNFEPCIIRMDPTYNEAFPVAKATMLHEMCHVESWTELDQHGIKWQACMHKIWLEGAFDGLI